MTWGKDARDSGKDKGGKHEHRDPKPTRKAKSQPRNFPAKGKDKGKGKDGKGKSSWW